MRVHVLQHVPFEPPGAVEQWAADRGHDCTITHLHAGESLPAVEDLDWLVVLGGPMGVHDTEEYPWLAAERALVADAIDADRAVLGICLGAQQVAAALGADVYPASTPEIGWFPIEATAEASGSPLFDALGDSYDALHWHGDTFDLPEGATRMARTEACPNQAFVYDDRVVGLQFHLESTPDAVAELLANTDDLPAGPRVQDASTIRDGTHRTAALEPRLYALLDNLEREWRTDEADERRADESEDVPVHDTET